MSITRPKPQTMDAFVQAAPDAARKPVRKGKREQLTFTFEPELVEQMDAFATARGLSRASLARMSVIDYMKRNG